MARYSSTPWTVPSSPYGPCRALNATSGRNAASTAPTSRSTSTRVTRYPSLSNASAHAFLEESDTGRSDENPPINTATCLTFIPCPPFDAGFVVMGFLTVSQSVSGGPAPQTKRAGRATRLKSGNADVAKNQRVDSVTSPEESSVNQN